MISDIIKLKTLLKIKKYIEKQSLNQKTKLLKNEIVQRHILNILNSKKTQLLKNNIWMFSYVPLNHLLSNPKFLLGNMNTLTANKSNNNTQIFQNKLISNCLNTKSKVNISPWIKEYLKCLNDWKKGEKIKKIYSLSCATLLISCLSATEIKIQKLLKEYPKTLKSVSIKLILKKMKMFEKRLKNKNENIKTKNDYLELKFILYKKLNKILKTNFLDRIRNMTNSETNYNKIVSTYKYNIQYPILPMMPFALGIDGGSCLDLTIFELSFFIYLGLLNSRIGSTEKFIRMTFGGIYRNIYRRGQNEEYLMKTRSNICLFFKTIMEKVNGNPKLAKNLLL